MNDPDSIELIQGIYAAFGSGDFEQVLARLAPDVDWIVPGPAHVLPWCGSYRGHAGVRECFGLIDRHLKPQASGIDLIVARGDKVVVTGHERHRVKATGREFESPWVHIFTVQDGKVTRFQEINDNHPAVEASQPG